MIWFTSDTHFGDKNIIKCCKRPFITVEEMNESIINNWNSCVNKDDIVYHLGDVFGNPNYNALDKVSILQNLNGIKYLVKGNHDTKSNHYYRSIGFEEVYDCPIIVKEFLILSHEPMPFAIQSQYSESPMVHLYGHVHNSSLFQTFYHNNLCVCPERHNYKPISLDDIKSYLK